MKSRFEVSVRSGKVIGEKGVALDSKLTLGMRNLDYYEQIYPHVA